MEHPTGLARGLQTDPCALFGSGWDFDHHGIVAVGRLHALGADREGRSVRHRSGGLKLEFHGVGAVGQVVAFGRGEHESAHVQTQHSIGGREVILAAMPSLTPDHLIEEGRTLLVVEDHPTGTDALQHKVGGAFLGTHIDVQGRRCVFVLFEPRFNGKAIVRGAALGFFVFHGHGGGRAQRKVIRTGHDGVLAAGYRASLSVNKAPTKALELEVFANVDGTAVLEVDAGCVPTAVVDHVSRRVGRPPVRTACGRRLNNQVVLAEVADAHGRLDDFSGPEGVVLPIESKREAKRVGVGFMPNRRMLHHSLTRRCGQHERTGIVEVSCIERDRRHQADLPWCQGLNFILARSERRPRRVHEVQGARLGRPVQGGGSSVSPAQKEDFSIFRDLGAEHADAFQEEVFGPCNGSLNVNRGACRGP